MKNALPLTNSINDFAPLNNSVSFDKIPNTKQAHNVPRNETQNHQNTSSIINNVENANSSNKNTFDKNSNNNNNNEIEILEELPNPYESKPPKPKILAPEICIECMMRDRDMADVDVSPIVWKRKSDNDIEKALSLWSQEESNGIPIQSRVGMKPQDEVSEENLIKWTTINPPVSNFRAHNLKNYVQDQVKRNNVNNTIDKTLDKILKFPSTSSLNTSSRSSMNIEEPNRVQRRRRLSESGATSVASNRTSRQNLAISLANAPPLPTNAVNQIERQSRIDPTPRPINTKSNNVRPISSANELLHPTSPNQLEVPISPKNSMPTSKRPFSFFFKHSNRSAATSVASNLPSGSMVDMHLGLDRDPFTMIPHNKPKATSVNEMEMWSNNDKGISNGKATETKKKKKGLKGLWNKIRGKSNSHNHNNHHTPSVTSGAHSECVPTPSIDDKNRESSLLELQAAAEKEDTSSPLPPPPSMSFLSGERVRASSHPSLSQPRLSTYSSSDTLATRPSMEMENEIVRSKSGEV